MKKALKNLVRQATEFLPSSAILVLHHVTENPVVEKSGCKLSMDAFRQFVLQYHRYATLYEVLRHPEQKQVALTFDDGLEDLYTIAYPFLVERKIPFTAFIVTDFLDMPGYITTAQLKTMSRNPLVTIGAHGVTHKVLTELSRNEKKRELTESQTTLEQLTGRKVDVFAYSHGLADEETIELMEHYRYGLVVYARHLNVLTGRNRFRIPRYNIETNNFTEMTAELAFLEGRR